MKITLLLLSLLASLASPSPADTIYQMNAQGRQVVVQLDAIVVSEDSSFLVYKHFDLKDRRVEIVRLTREPCPSALKPPALTTGGTSWTSGSGSASRPR